MPKAPGKFQQIVLREAPGVQAQDIALLVLRAGEKDTAIGAGQLQGVRIVPLFRSLFRSGGEQAQQRKRKELFDAHDQISFSDRAGLGPDTFDHSVARDARAGKQARPIPRFMMPPERDAGAGALAGPSPHELRFSHRTGGVLRLRRTSLNGTLPKNSPPRAIWVSIPTEKFSLDKSAKLL